MLWNATQSYYLEPFDSESELEKAIIEVAPSLFGASRVYLDIKRRIGDRDGIQNIPDKDSSKYILEFAAPAEPIGPIRLVPRGVVKAPQAPRYTSRARLMAATGLDEAF